MSYEIFTAVNIANIESPTHDITALYNELRKNAKVTVIKPRLVQFRLELTSYRFGHSSQQQDLVIVVYTDHPLAPQIFLCPLSPPKQPPQCSVVVKLNPVFLCRDKIPPGIFLLRRAITFSGEVLFITDCCSTSSAEKVELARDSLLLFLTLMKTITNSAPFNIRSAFCAVFVAYVIV